MSENPWFWNTTRFERDVRQFARSVQRSPAREGTVTQFRVPDFVRNEERLVERRALA